jgi:hypothetical protein
VTSHAYTLSNIVFLLRATLMRKGSAIKNNLSV